MRGDEWQYRISLALSGFTLVLVVVYLVLVQDDRSIQAEVNRRQQFINQSIELGRINDALVRSLAAAASAKKDDRLRDLLARNGITIDASGKAATAPPAPPASPPPPKEP